MLEVVNMHNYPRLVPMEMRSKISRTTSWKKESFHCNPDVSLLTSITFIMCTNLCVSICLHSNLHT